MVGTDATDAVTCSMSGTNNTFISTPTPLLVDPAFRYINAAAITSPISQ
jgi:hypothetical protein